MFSTLSQREIVILEMFNLSSANAFNLVMSKNLSFGNGLLNASTSTFAENNKPYQPIRDAVMDVEFEINTRVRRLVIHSPK